MAVATYKITPETSANKDEPFTAEPLNSEPLRIQVIDDLLLNSARLYPKSPYLGYPETSRGNDDYVYHTFEQLDSYVDEAARSYTESGLIADPSPSRAEVVALLASSNLEYVVSIFALSRMGFAILFLSNRLSTEAYVNLLKETECTKIVSSPSYSHIVREMQAASPLKCFQIIRQAVFSTPKPLASRFPAAPSYPDASHRISFIVHSSGSTGLPKPIFQTHQACISNYSGGIPYRAFLTLPLFHNHGISTLIRAMCANKRVALYNSNLPLSRSTLVDSMKAVQPESLHCVPYALKLLAEGPDGIEALKRCKLVLYGGSSCPDDLGDKLVEEGVYLVGHYGATEMGQLMTSFRDASDKAWNYMRPLASTKPYLRMVDTGEGTFECVVLDGLPSKVVSNSDDPPNSFHTRDTFIPHPDMPDAWKYLGRLDDRITLVNGEKVLPIPYEHYIRQHDLVQETVVFGVGKSVPGLIIIPSEKARGMDKEELLLTLWPIINAANTRTEAFGRVPPEMVHILDCGTQYPMTDKGTVIRAQFYKQFSTVIDNVYALFEAPDSQDGNKNLLILEEPELVEYLLKLFVDRLGTKNLTSSTDFFEVGVDSLQAITARAQIMREIDLGGKVLGQNVVFEYPRVELLSKHIHAIRTSAVASEESEIEVMARLIAKYSEFPEWEPGTLEPVGETLILTGSTGSLGVHILSQVARRPDVRKIYCLVRASSPSNAEERVYASIESKGLPIPSSEERCKIVCLPSDLSQASLGLDADILDELRNTLTVVIHSAWAVNFNMGVRSFESHHIRGTYNLLNMCLGTKTTRPARLFFCSSISAGAGTPIPGRVPETYIPNLAHAQAMGYARSKMVTEHVIKAAVEKTKMNARVLRLGQIIGDTTNGIWNLTEALPLMIRGAQTFGAMPSLDETPSWMPVNKMASACLELAGLVGQTDSLHSAENIKSSPYPSVVYQVQNTHLFHWTRDLLPALRSAGLEFKTVPQREWVRLLRESKPDPTKNPTIKLLDFFEGKYDNDEPGREGLVFETKLTAEASNSVREGFDVIGSGLVDRMVAWWKTQW